MSLVLRVISDETVNLSISAAEKEETFPKIALRISLDAREPITDAR